METVLTKKGKKILLARSMLTKRAAWSSDKAEDQ